ncbi:unnamed protein product [Hydatigera taeniaeformis]|uniref:Pecanex-like protein n=1 Tax=Hydatigena taeniaeformis TaxID=6205 RepID=A0A0R3WMS1_HYDTA|nr:unnamed protein product [Hydatigera taeniaeformis]
MVHTKYLVVASSLTIQQSPLFPDPDYKPTPESNRTSPAWIKKITLELRRYTLFPQRFSPTRDEMPKLVKDFNNIPDAHWQMCVGQCPKPDNFFVCSEVLVAMEALSKALVRAFVMAPNNIEQFRFSSLLLLFSLLINYVKQGEREEKKCTSVFIFENDEIDSVSTTYVCPSLATFQF